MTFLGGKWEIRKWIAEVVARFRAVGQPIWEPFCGGLNTAAVHGGEVWCSDIQADLIGLYRAVRAGWVPPNEVSRETYAQAKQGMVPEPLRAFALFGCSFRGIKGAGYSGRNVHWAQRKGRPAGLIRADRARAARRALLRDVPRVSQLITADFLALSPAPTPFLIYCDPPYQGVTGYGFAFNHERFFERCVEWGRHTTVLVSEYSCPVGECVSELERNSNIHNGKTRPVERIYRIGGKSL